MLDFVLACARKEPHYRIYFWPSLGIALGRRFFDPTVMPCWLNYPRAICKYTDFSVSVKSSAIIIFGNPVVFCAKAKLHKPQTQADHYLLYCLRNDGIARSHWPHFRQESRP